MTERVASSTAVLVCQLRATADGRYAVGRFSDPIARELLDPADRLIAELSAPDSQLVVNYQTKSLPTTVMRGAMRLAARVSGA